MFLKICLVVWLAVLSYGIFDLRMKVLEHGLGTESRILENGRQDKWIATVKNSDALRLDDRSDPKGNFLEIGRYEFGWTFLTPHRIELHPKDEVSVSCYGAKCLPRFQVRNIGDTEGAVWINGNNIIGSQFGPLKFAFGSFNDGGREIARFEKDGTFMLHGDMMVDKASLIQTIAELKRRIAELESRQEKGAVRPVSK